MNSSKLIKNFKSKWKVVVLLDVRAEILKLGQYKESNLKQKFLKAEYICNLHIPLPEVTWLSENKEGQPLSQVCARIDYNSSRIDAILNALCTNCISQCREAPIVGDVACTTCDKVFCKNCVVNSRCFRCGKMVCNSHCIKCHICNKRSCKSKNCITDFRICQLCEYTFCQEHFEAHKDFNTQEEYGIKCLTKKCKLNFKIQLDGMKKFMGSIINASLIKELKLRN